MVLFPAALGCQQGSSEPLGMPVAMQGNIFRRRGRWTAFCAVAYKAVWPREDTSFSHSCFLICILWRIIGPAVLGFL